MTEFACRSEQCICGALHLGQAPLYNPHCCIHHGASRCQLKPGDIIKVDLRMSTTDGAGITDAIFYQIETLQEGQGGSVAIEAHALSTQRLGGVNDVSVVAYETHQGQVSVQ